MLYCFNCQLTALDMSQCPRLVYFSCANNPLGILDVSNNPALTVLSCEGCRLYKKDCFVM